MKGISKILFCLFTAVFLVVSMCLPAFAEGEYVAPVQVVDLTTQAGFDTWKALADEFDTKALVNGEYSRHGMDGKVTATFMNEDGGFARFVPTVPLSDEADLADAPKNDFRTTAELDVEMTGKSQYLAFCYRISKGAHLSTNAIYFRDTTKGSEYLGEFNGNPGYYMSSQLKISGDWEVKVIELKTNAKVKDVLKGIRVPIAGGVNEYFDVKWYVVFNETDNVDKNTAKALAKDFDINAYHAYLESLATPAPTDEPTAAPTVAPSDKGCGSVITGFAGLVMLMGAAAFVAKKK